MEAGIRREDGYNSFNRTWCFRDGRYFERRPDDQNQVHMLPIFLQRAVKVVCELLPKKSYVRLRKSAGKVTLAMLRVR